MPRLFLIPCAFILTGCFKPDAKPIPDAYLNATRIWAAEEGDREIELKIGDSFVMISANTPTTSVSTIQFPDGNGRQDLFSHELYFAATEIKYDQNAGVIFTKVEGFYPGFGLSGVRIFEFDIRHKKILEEFWIEVGE
jgi:hypothetical protein